MPVSVRDVADVIKMAAEVIKNTREIIKAVNDGAAYLKRNHPSAGADVRELLGQMERTIGGLAQVMKVASSFRFFALDLKEYPDAAQRELARFNDYLVEQEGEVGRLRADIRALKGNCEAVRRLRDKLDAQANAQPGWMFTLFGLDPGPNARRLYDDMNQLYSNDLDMIRMIECTLDFVTKILQDVGDALGPPGAAYPHNVPVAATLLGTYAGMLREPERQLQDLADDMNAIAQSLR